MASPQATTIRQRSRDEWRSVLRRQGIRPTRSMGQNFLIEPEVVAAIVDVAQAGAGDNVVEVGPGLGILTRELLTRGSNVLAIELDRDLAAFLRHDLANVTAFSLIEADARHADVAAWAGADTWHLVANLPYSTGTAILRHFLELERPPTASTVMVQREVAERMAANAPNMSLLALAVQILAVPEVAFIVPPNVFEPPPKVESAVVHLAQRPTPLLNTETRERFFRVASLAFQQKRKTLANSLAKGMGRTKPEVEGLLQRADIDPSLRPQAVGLDAWCHLARMLPA